MSATIMRDSMMMPATESSQAVTAKLAVQNDVDFAKCECCGLTEECTPAYIDRIRERYQGKWICGLCSEAVKDEIVRCDRLISTEEALAKHIAFYKKFNSAGPSPDPAVHLISAMRQILRRSLDSPRSLRSMPSSPTKNSSRINLAVLTRSESCIPSLSLADSGSSSHQTIDEGSE